MVIFHSYATVCQRVMRCPLSPHWCPFPISCLINRRAVFTPNYNRYLMIDGIPVTGPSLFPPKGHKLLAFTALGRGRSSEHPLHLWSLEWSLELEGKIFPKTHRIRMYGIYANIWGILMVNVTGSYGLLFPPCISRIGRRRQMSRHQEPKDEELEKQVLAPLPPRGAEKNKITVDFLRKSLGKWLFNGELMILMVVWT